MKEITAEKAAIIAECFVWTQPDTGKIIKYGYEQVMLKFPGHGKSTIRLYSSDFKKQQAVGILAPNLGSKKKGICGRLSKLTPELRERYRELCQECAESGS